MRIKLTLHHRANAQVPINSNYAISSMIYHKLGEANRQFATQLHEEGWTVSGRKFKLFTFSRLRPQRYGITGDRLVLQEGPTSLTISFFVHEALGHFIEGLFKAYRFSIGDEKSQTDFEVESVDILPEIAFGDTMRFRLKSPVCISHQGETDRYAQYLAPDHDRYQEIFFNNLVNKFVASQMPPSSPQQEETPEMRLKILTKPKSKLIHIKPDQDQPIKIKGYTFDFEIQAPIELIQTGYWAGFGEKNSMGFGYAELL